MTGETACPACCRDAVRKDGRDRPRVTAWRATPRSASRFPPEVIAPAVEWAL